MSIRINYIISKIMVKCYKYSSINNSIKNQEFYFICNHSNQMFIFNPMDSELNDYKIIYYKNRWKAFLFV